VTSIGTGAGIIGTLPKDHIIQSLVWDITLGEFKFALVRIDPETDERALITDLTNAAQGVTESDRFITDLAIERLGKILIGTARGSGQADSAIFRVDPVTGKRRLLSDFADAAQGADVADLWFSRGLAIETSGQILAASGGSIAVPRNLLLRIDRNTGQRTSSALSIIRSKAI
jgi:hypothetical protein